MRPFLIAFPACLLLSGCGGSGSSRISNEATVEILWKTRSRQVVGPASAESVQVTLDFEAEGFSDVSVTADRPKDEKEDMRQSLTLPGPIPVGEALLTVEFFNERGGIGKWVGVARGLVSVSPGSVVGTVATDGQIVRVEVVKGQSVNVGETKPIAISTYNDEGVLIPIVSAAYVVGATPVSGDATPSGSSLTGVRRGTVACTATVDGITSPVEEVVVSPVGKTYLVTPLGGGAGLTFVNDLSADGQVAVGSSRGGDGHVRAIRWTREGGTVEVPGLSVFSGANVATCVNRDGTLIGGSNAQPNDSDSVPWVWTAATGTQQLPLPQGFHSGRVTDVSDDGSVLVGTAIAPDGKSWALSWKAGTVSTEFEGVGECVAPDGGAIGGQIQYHDGRTVGFVILGPGYFFTTLSTSPDIYLESVKGLSEGYTFAAGIAGKSSGAPGFWTPASGPVLVNGTITTEGSCVSRDGLLMGISGGDPWLAMVFSRKVGLTPLGRYFDQVKQAGGPDLVQPFAQAGNGPATTAAISDDRMTVCGSALPITTGEVRGYVTDFVGFRKL